MNDTELKICKEAYTQYKKISAAYLMRKLKCDKDHALELVDEFFENYRLPTFDENIGNE